MWLKWRLSLRPAASAGFQSSRACSQYSPWAQLARAVLPQVRGAISFGFRSRWPGPCAVNAWPKLWLNHLFFTTSSNSRFFLLRNLFHLKWKEIFVCLQNFHSKNGTNLEKRPWFFTIASLSWMVQLLGFSRLDSRISQRCCEHLIPYVTMISKPSFRIFFPQHALLSVENEDSPFQVFPTQNEQTCIENAVYDQCHSNPFGGQRGYVGSSQPHSKWLCRLPPCK